MNTELNIGNRNYNKHALRKQRKDKLKAANLHGRPIRIYMNIGLVGLILSIVQVKYYLGKNFEGFCLTQIHYSQPTAITGEEGFSALVDFPSSLFPMRSTKCNTLTEFRKILANP